MVRHASEPTTGTMVVAALLVVATVRHKKTRNQ
jgi:hypothetical protein